MDIFSSLGSNAIISGGAILILLGGLVAYARAIPARVLNFLKSKFIFSVEIEHGDSSFGWVLEWMQSHPSAKRAKDLYVVTKFTDENRDSPHLIYSPKGLHYFRHNGKFFWVSRSREKMQGNGVIAGLYETLTIRTLARNRGAIEELVMEARNFSYGNRSGKVPLYSLDEWGNGWTEIALKRPRKIDSVVLPKSVIDRTYEDVKEFLDKEDWYLKVGVPYRRGYLLTGPPGNGKTSLVFSIASELKRSVSIVTLSDKSLTDKRILSAFSTIPVNTILLIEDIDAIFNKRTAVAEGSGLTFSGFINALDGVATPDGRILFMTSNHPENLDDALIRPGRVDQNVCISVPEEQQIISLFERFYNDKENSSKFAKVIASKSLSAARIQEHFVRYPNSSDALNKSISI